MERGARLSGSRFGYIVGDTARLALALYRWALDRAVAAGFSPVIPPVLVREEAMYGTGFFPAERFEIYEIADEGLYLTGTSEVALAGLHMGEILERDQLPLRYTAFSTNFRREAGAAGRDTRGMFRVHQFNKVELFAYVLPEESWDEHERLLAIEESLAQELGLPYRVVNIEASELSAAAAKRYDLEAWFPSQQRYRELTSASNTTDYQSRRLGIRYRANGHTEYVHTLNGTAVTDRWALAVLENFQGEVPEVLQEFGAPAEDRVVSRAFACGALLYRYARLLGDAEALASGDPKRITRRAKNKLLGRALGPLRLLALTLALGSRPGGVPERSNGAVLKTASAVTGARGFESHPRRWRTSRRRRTASSRACFTAGTLAADRRSSRRRRWRSSRSHEASGASPVGASSSKPAAPGAGSCRARSERVLVNAALVVLVIAIGVAVVWSF